MALPPQHTTLRNPASTPKPGPAPAAAIGGAPRHRLIGEMLVEAQFINRDQLEMALAEQKRTRTRIGEVLVRLNFVDEARIAEFVALQNGLTFRRLSNKALDPTAIAMIPEVLARRHLLIPIGRSGNVLQLAMALPTDVVALDAVRETARLLVEPVVAMQSEIVAAIDRNYRSNVNFEEAFERAIAVAEAKGTELDTTIISKGPIVELVDQLLNRAIEERATDIHIQPEEGILRIRLRVDGLLQAGPMIPKALQAACTARIKVMAGLNISENRLPQDGRIRFQMKNRAVDLRCSTFLTNFGENVVLRVLDRNSVPLSLEKLGFLDEGLQQFNSVIRRPHGIILVTGPTGSGKTTTLYAALSALNSIDRNIMTIEDPIEYELPLVRQSMVNVRAGITFSAGLRAILRQDPDIILIGEMRDEETSQMAVRAALTGHLVFSTLHTNTSAGAVARLVDLGVEPLLITTSVIAVMAQRLCRSLCPQCKVEEPIPDDLKTTMEYVATRSGLKEVRAWKGEGCFACKDTGYMGRVSITEMFELDAKLRELIFHRRFGQELSDHLKADGMRTMFQDGLRKVMMGITSLAEVDRILEPELRGDLGRTAPASSAPPPISWDAPMLVAPQPVAARPVAPQQVAPMPLPMDEVPLGIARAQDTPINPDEAFDAQSLLDAVADADLEDADGDVSL